MTETSIRLDICCGSNKPQGFIGVDIVACTGVDIVHDLTDAFPFENDYADHIRAHDAIEHLPDKLKTMNEIFRVCKNGATVDIKVPSTDGRGAWQDPTHVSFWNINSFLYYSDDYPHYELGQRYGFKGNFKINELYNLSGVDGVVWVIAHMRALK